MVETAIDQLRRTRANLVKTLEELPLESLLRIPEGFRNNLLWNIGHIVVSQQGLHYRLSNLPLYVTDEQVAQFRRGSDPTSWTGTPDVELLKRQLVELPERLVEDYRSGRFAEYNEFNTFTGPALRSIEDAILFNMFHEGYHSGIVSALRRLVG
jgi:DinB superfamily